MQKNHWQRVPSDGIGVYVFRLHVPAGWLVVTVDDISGGDKVYRAAPAFIPDIEHAWELVA